MGFLRLFVVLFWLNPSAFATEQSPLIVSGSPDFAAKIFDHLQVLPDSEGQPSPAEIGSGALDGRFQQLKSSLRMITNDRYAWYRVAFRNPEHVPIEVVLNNTFGIYSMFVVHRTDTIKIKEIGFGSKNFNDAGIIIPAHELSIPPGESTLYLGLNTFRHISRKDFEVRSKKSFQALHSHKVVLYSSIMLAMGAMFLYNFFLFIVMRSRLYFFYLLANIGILGLEARISGVLALLDPTITLKSGFMWIYASFTGLCGAGFFSLEYFGITRKEHPRIWGSMIITVVLCLLMVLSYSVIWPIALPLMALTLVTISIIVTIGISRIHLSSREKTWLFAIAFLPIITSTLVFSLAFIIVDDYSVYHLLFIFSGFFNSYTLTFLISQKINSINKSREVLEASLKAIIPPTQLKKVLRDNISLDGTPVVRYVSIMFIDIVGYSIASRKQLPTESFNALKSILQGITKIVLNHGGIIDKSLGDGCLCFFGYNMAGEPNIGHELAALQCALAIQRQTIAEINSMGDTSTKEVFPLRIGINSAEVCIGNMGDENRFDFTMIGEGVVMASRFETACEPFKIIIGRSTYDALKNSLLEAERFYPRLVPIKHDVPLVESFEINPFENDPSSLERGRHQYWRSINAKPRHERFVVSAPQASIPSEFGDMELINFSHDGFCLKSKMFLGRGVEVHLDIGKILTDHSAKVISPLSVQVVWGAPGKHEEFIIGTKIIGLSADKRRMLLQNLKTCCL
jgi:class 3 adenylate cyclase